jgi:hypothetical protein
MEQSVALSLEKSLSVDNDLPIINTALTIEGNGAIIERSLAARAFYMTGGNLGGAMRYRGV